VTVDSTPEALYHDAARLYGAALGRLARAYEADADLRRDLLQEIHIALWRSFSTFDGRCSFRTWIYRIAVNQARNRHRFWRRRHRADQVSLDEHVAAHGEFLSGGEATPDQVLAQKELAGRLRAHRTAPARAGPRTHRAVRHRAAQPGAVLLQRLRRVQPGLPRAPG